MQEQRQVQETDEKFYVKSGLLFLAVFEIVILFMYGFYTSYTTVSYVTPLLYILTNALAVLGFGLILVYWRFGVQQTLVIAIVVCSVNAQLGPLMQQFWYNVFVQGFYAGQALDTPSTFYLMKDTAVKDVNNITLGFVRISTYCSISLLVALTAIIGKIGIVTTFFTTIIFNIGFNLNYYLNYLIYLRGSNTVYSIMDDFQGSRVFMFGAGFGLALMLIYMRSQPVVRTPTAQYTDIFAAFLTLLGTAFVLILFYFVLDSYALGSNLTALLNIYFAFCASIITSIAISCILGGVVTFHQVNMSVISGALQVSIIGTFIQTPYVSMLVGVLAGAVTGLFSFYLHTKINQKQIKDSKGIISIYLFNCFLCSYFVCPIIIKAYENYLDQGDIYNEGYHMIYTSISLGIGFLFGLLACIFRAFFKENILLSDLEFFNKHYMLPTAPRQRPKPQPVFKSEAHTQEQLTIQKSQHETTKNPQETGIFIRV